MSKGIYVSPTEFVEFDKQNSGLDFATREKSINSIANALKVLPDPDPVLTKMGKDISALEELLTDNRVESAIYAQRLPALDDYTIYFEEKGKDVELLKSFLAFDMHEETTLASVYASIFNAVLFGYSVQELMWEKVGNMLLPSKIIEKPQSWFKHKNGEWVFISKQNRDGESLPQNKFLITQNRATYTNPYGKKLLSKLFWFVTFKKNGWKFFFTFAEKYGMPWAVGKLPRNSTQETRDTMLANLEGMVQDAIAVVPDDSSVELLELKAKTGNAHKEFIEMCNTEIAITILGQNLTTEVKGGSYAAAQTHEGVSESIARSDKKLVESSLNRLIKMIWQVNGKTNPPKLELFKSQDVDTELASRDKTLTETGVKFTKGYYMKAYGFEDGDIEVSAQDTQKSTNFSEFAEPSSVQTELDRAIDALLSSPKTKTALAGVIDPIVDAFKNSGNYDEAVNALALAFPKMDDEGVMKLLERAIFVSEAVGMTSED